MVPTDPAAALRLALPKDVLAQIRAANPDASLEAWGDWSSPADVVVEDDFEHGTTRTHTSITHNGRSLQVYFAAATPRLTTGATLTIEGLQIGDMLAVSQATVTPAVTTCTANGAKRVVFIMVNFPNSQIPASLTTSALKSTVSGSAKSLDGYWREASGGQISATADAFGPFTLSTNYTSSQYNQLRDAAITAAAGSVTFANYNYVVIVAPPAFPTGGGLGTIGCSTLNYPGTGTFRAGVVWVRSDFVAANDLAVCALGHENGHNLGLEHASSESFGSVPLGPVASVPFHDEYGDRFSLMGLCYTFASTTLLGHYAAPQKIGLGWLGSQNYRNVSANGTFTLVPAESGSTGLQALKVLRSTASNQYLWIEYRQPTGYDATFGSSGFGTQIYSGALIHFEDPADSAYTGYTRLLNFQAATLPGNFDQPVLVAGSTWQDPDSSLSITLGSATAAGLAVTINYQGTANHTPSVISLAPVTGTGATETYTFKFADTAGATDLNVVNVLINTALDGRRACYIAYSLSSNTIYLVSDAGDGTYAGTFRLNGSAAVSNSQCTIFGTGSSATTSGGTLTLTLNMSFTAAFAGNKVIYLAARDSVANNTGWLTMGVRGVPPLPSTFPNPVSMTPPSGSASLATIGFSYQDATSTANLQTMWALINTAIDGRNACYVAYYRPGNLVFLFPDSGDGSLATSMLLSGSGTLSNSQCTITANASSVTVSGNQLTVNLNITFKAGFTGPKGVWMAAQTLAAQTSPWQALGAWQVP